MQDAAHIMMILDIEWLINFCHKAIWPYGLRSLLEKILWQMSGSH